MNFKDEAPDRIKFARLYYGLVLIVFFLRWKNNMLLSQLESPSLTYLGTDITYIFFAWSGITNFLGQHYLAALVFDISLLTSALISFLFPKQRIANIVFTILLAVYIVVGYSFLCFHKHNLTGLWFASLMFLPSTLGGFQISFELIRVYCLFAYASAGFWKFFRGVWDGKGHFLTIVKNDALGYLVQHPVSYLSKVISWLIAHPGLLDNLMMVSCFAQLAFVVGFFTKRFDWLFFAFALSFHVLSLLLLRAYFMEFAVILITLLPIPALYRNGDNRIS
jgi:hypothetical protein